MTKNTLLNVGIIICKLVRLLYAVTFLILFGFFVHFQINPSAYKNVAFNNEMNFTKTDLSSFQISKSTSYKVKEDGKVPEDSEVFKFNELKYSSLYLNFIKLSIGLLLSFLCVKEFQKIIESVKEIKTFQKRNSSSFRRIGTYLLIIAVLFSFSSYTFEQGGKSSFHISFILPFISLLAYIMAEIFKEGNNLLEENKLTI